MEARICLNDILKFEDLANVKIRFVLMVDYDWNLIEAFKNGKTDKLLDGMYWNYEKKRSFRSGQITVGFIPLKGRKNQYLLFHVGRIIKDLNILQGVGYEFETLAEYEKYFGRLIIRYKNKSQNMVRKAESVIEQCEVFQILPEIFSDDVFPGYDRVNISWETLCRVVEYESWVTALQNQKGIYLITDTQTKKLYVGAAYGESMILGRWRTYVNTIDGGNKDFKSLPPGHIQNNFRYTILEIFKSSTADEVIIEREHWWMNVLQTRNDGYNNPKIAGNDLVE